MNLFDGIPSSAATCTRCRCPKEQQPLPPNLQQFARVQRIAQLKMSGRAGGGAAKRQRQQQAEEEDAPASLETTVHPEPLTLLALVKSHFDTLDWA